MREALFRAAQLGAWLAIEESIGQRQSETITRHVFERSAYPCRLAAVDALTGRPATIVWPYPRGSPDVIDRANCADQFLRMNPHFRVLTEYTLGDQRIALNNFSEDLLVFCPFDVAVPLMDHNAQGQLCLCNRPVTAVTSEMMVGYLARAGKAAHPVQQKSYACTPTIARIGTKFVNGTGITLFKAAQMALFDRHRQELSRLGVTSPGYRVVWNRQEAQAACGSWFAQDQTVVFRPFAASQGTGVSFVGPRGTSTRERAVDEVIDRMQNAMADKYGFSLPYPITLSTFVESKKIDGRINDLRIFVVADNNNHCLRAIPGMVRLAQVAFKDRDEVDIGSCATNLNAPADPDAMSGPRQIALTSQDVLAKLGLCGDDVVRMGKVATLLWGTAIEEEHTATGSALPFAYGSVDFVLTCDGLAVPIEMNGANVGSHASVHPTFLDAFGAGMCAALGTVVGEE